MALGLPVLGYIASTPRITEQNFLLVIWLSWALASVALIFRLSLRATIYRRLQSDDFLAILAWILFLANNVLWCTQANMVYTLVDIQGPTMPMDLTAVGILAKKFIKMLINFNLITNASLWMVKFSFLMFFRNLRKKNVSWKIWWCMVSLVTVGAWVVTIGDMQHNCATHDIEYVIENCTTTGSAKTEARILLVAACMDVLTNLLIMTFPILILHKGSAAWSRKLCLLALASIVLACIALALAKALVTFRNGFTTDVTWSLSLGHIETALALIVLCLGSFRQLYTNEGIDLKVNSRTGSMEKPETKKRHKRYPGDSGLGRFVPFLPQRWSITSSTRSLRVQHYDSGNDPEMDLASEQPYRRDSKPRRNKKAMKLAVEEIIPEDSREHLEGTPPSPVTSVQLGEALLAGYTSSPAPPQPVVTKERSADSSCSLVHQSLDPAPSTHDVEQSSRSSTWFRSRANTPDTSSVSQKDQKDHSWRKTPMSRFARPSRHFRPTLEINVGVDVVKDWRWQFADKVERQLQKSPALV